MKNSNDCFVSNQKYIQNVYDFLLTLIEKYLLPNIHMFAMYGCYLHLFVLWLCPKFVLQVYIDL